MLKRYHGDGDYIAKWYSIVLDKDFQYEKELVANLDNDLCKLRTKEIKSLKVQKNHLFVAEATLEIDNNMRDKYPQLFFKQGTASFFSSLFPYVFSLWDE